MDPYRFSLEEVSLSRPAGRRLVSEFLSAHGLRFDEGLEKYYGIYSGGELVGGLGRQSNVIKCAAVDTSLRGEGLLGALVSRAVTDMRREGAGNIFVFTKPESGVYFRDLGFSPVESVSDVVLLESDGKAFEGYLRECELLQGVGKTGAVVMNCNPFTLGHRYLVEQALEKCDSLVVFVVEEDASMFPYADRIRLVREGTADLGRVRVMGGGSYIISAATFPSYFIKDSERVDSAHAELDLTIFGKHIAPAAGIAERFVGEEPLCRITSEYNRVMGEMLPKFGVGVTVIPRKNEGGAPISASRVRKLLKEDRLAELKTLVPESTYSYLQGLGNAGGTDMK